MAGKRRHWKEKNGRFWARVAVPKSLQAILGKSELIEPLGGDLRTADRKHAAAVARLQAQIQQARQSAEGGTEKAPTEANNRTLTPDDKVVAAWLHYTHLLQVDEHKRDAMPTPAEIEAEYETAMQPPQRGGFLCFALSQVRVSRKSRNCAKRMFARKVDVGSYASPQRQDLSKRVNTATSLFIIK